MSAGTGGVTRRRPATRRLTATQAQAERDACIAAIVAAAPPLTAAQREAVAAIFGAHRRRRRPAS
ncbi:hypothetical protein PSD17_56730 [Pseudonocardia sp. D17]|nr:hypothetical protein PSD17_56730 [Pseudonocardia sp. D17]